MAAHGQTAHSPNDKALAVTAVVVMAAFSLQCKIVYTTSM